MPRQPSRRRLRRKSVHCSLFRGCVILNQGFFALCGILVSLSVSLPRALWALRADRRLFQVRLGKARIYLLAAAVFTVNALQNHITAGFLVRLCWHAGREMEYVVGYALQWCSDLPSLATVPLCSHWFGTCSHWFGTCSHWFGTRNSTGIARGGDRH